MKPFRLIRGRLHDAFDAARDMAGCGEPGWADERRDYLKRLEKEIAKELSALRVIEKLVESPLSAGMYAAQVVKIRKIFEGL